MRSFSYSHNMSTTGDSSNFGILPANIKTMVDDPAKMSSSEQTAFVFDMLQTHGALYVKNIINELTRERSRIVDKMEKIKACQALKCSECQCYLDKEQLAPKMMIGLDGREIRMVMPYTPRLTRCQCVRTHD